MKRAVFFVFFLLFFVSRPCLALPVVEVTSAGGLKAWLVEEHHLPLITIKFSFRGGVETDPADKQGLAVLAANLLTQGAGPYDEKAFQARLADQSIQLNVSAQRDYVEGQLKTLARVKGEAFDLLRLALTDPQVAQDSLDRLRGQQVTSIRFQLSDPAWQGRYALYSAVYGAHPYGYRSLGTAQSLAQITREDVRSFLKGHLSKENLMIAVAGAIRPDELALALDEIFGTLPETAMTPLTPAFTWPDERFELLVAREGTQVECLFAGQMMQRDHADWYAAQIANYTLGGAGLTSRLMEEVRVRRGLTYGISTSLAPMDRSSLFLGRFSANNDKAVGARDALMHVWADYFQTGPTEAEVQEAKDYLIGAAALSLNTTEAVASMLLVMQQNNLGIDYLEKRDDYYESVTLEAVRRVIRAWFDPEKASFVYVGQPEGFAEIETRPFITE